MPVSVDPGRDQGVDVDDPPGFADLQDQGVGGHERVGAGVQRAGPELSDVLVELLGHVGDLGLGPSG